MEIDYSNIEPGDFVTAKFRDEHEGEFTISGTAHYASDGEGLSIAGWIILDSNRRTPAELLEITEHRVKEPEIGFFGRSDDGIYWARTKDHGWMSIWPTINVDNVEYGYTWEQVVYQLNGRGLMAVTA